MSQIRINEAAYMDSDGKTLVVSAHDDKAYVIDVATEVPVGSPLALPAGSGPCDVKMYRDGALILLGSAGGYLPITLGATPVVGTPIPGLPHPEYLAVGKLAGSAQDVAIVSHSDGVISFFDGAADHAIGKVDAPTGCSVGVVGGEFGAAISSLNGTLNYFRSTGPSNIPPTNLGANTTPWDVSLVSFQGRAAYAVPMYSAQQYAIVDFSGNILARIAVPKVGTYWAANPSSVASDGNTIVVGCAACISSPTFPPLVIKKNAVIFKNGVETLLPGADPSGLTSDDIAQVIIAGGKIIALDIAGTITFLPL